MTTLPLLELHTQSILHKYYLDVSILYSNSLPRALSASTTRVTSPPAAAPALGPLARASSAPSLVPPSSAATAGLPICAWLRQTAQTSQGRRRIHQLSDSSSQAEETLHCARYCRLGALLNVGHNSCLPPAFVSVDVSMRPLILEFRLHSKLLLHICGQ